VTDNTPTTNSPASIDAAMRADIPRLRDAFLALSAAYSFAKESVREDGDRSCVHPLTADDLAIVKRVVNRVAIMLEDGTYGAEGFLASVGVTIDVASLRERTRQAEALAQIHREERDACAREVLSQRETIARLTRERDDAAVYSRDVCDAVENVRVMLAGTLDALDAARARLGTVEGSVWLTT
jgi:hypothetical protein